MATRSGRLIATAAAALMGLSATLTGCATTTPSASRSLEPQTSSTAATLSPAGSRTTASASAASSPSTNSAKPATSTPAETASGKPKARPAAVLAPGAQGDKVRELQHRLQQLSWFSGSLSGTYGSSTTTAVKGYQAKRGLPVTGRVDQATWQSLLARTRTPADDELSNASRPGPALMKAGSTGTQVKKLQARLAQLDWFSGKVTGTYGTITTSGVQGFQGKRGLPVTGEVDQRTWDRLVAMTREPTPGELNNGVSTPTTAALDARCLKGRVLCISKSHRSLRWVVDGQVQRAFDVRFGSELTPTREGVFAVTFKSRDHVSSLYHTAMPFAMFFSGGQAVHYSADFAARGYNGASHGCVNVRDYAGIRALFDEVGVGTKVVVSR